MILSRNILNIIKNILLGLALCLIFSSSAKAESDTLPQMMVGQALLTTKDAYGNVDMTIYGGATGNYAVYNTNDNPTSPNTMLSYDNSLTDGVLKCYDSIQTTPCFIHKYLIENQKKSVQAMTSTTYVDGKAEYQMPAMYTYYRVAVGDAVMPNYDNFALWGKSLAQSEAAVNPSAGASWALGGYAINDKSQSAWGADTEGEYAKFDEKMQTLRQGATTISAASLYPVGNTLYLQTLNLTDITINSGTLAEKNAKYPEGRVWFVNGSVTIPANKTIKYIGIGTIIIKGNLVVENGTKIEPVDEKNDKLGIIVLGS